jgi:hypothetical protein
MHLSSLISGYRQDWLCAAIYLLPLLDEHEGRSHTHGLLLRTRMSSYQDDLPGAFQTLLKALPELDGEPVRFLGFAICTESSPSMNSNDAVVLCLSHKVRGIVTS